MQTSVRQPDGGTASFSPLDSFQGLTISDIRFRGATDSDSLRPLLALNVGEPLEKHKLQRSIQALYATGRFATIQVEADRQEAGRLALVFVAEENYFIGSLTLEGAPERSPSASQLINASKLELGELYTREKVERGIERMRRVLEDYGFYRAAVRTSYLRHPDVRLVDVHFVVALGERARVGQVKVVGNPGFSEQKVRDIADLDPGDEVKPERVSRALRKLRDKYEDQDRLVASISVIEQTYQPDSNTVDYTFRIQRGPTVDVHIEGASLSKGRRKRYVPIYQEHAVDEALLSEGRRNMRDYFQTQGYFNVQVDYRLEREQENGDEHLHVIYRVEKGERSKLAKIEIRGNQYFRERDLRERMRIQEAGILLSHGRFSQSMLENDAEAIRNLYRSNGFRQVKVSTSVEEAYEGKQGQLRAVLTIDQGSQTRVGQLDIQGNDRISADTIREQVTSRPGQPFSETNVASDREAVLNFYFAQGFPEASFQARASQVSQDPPLMNVTYTIHEGPQVFVDRVLLSGLDHTRPYVVRREFQVEPGDPLNQNQMTETQRRLYDMGIFNEVNIAVQNPQGQAPEKNVVVQVEEAKRYTFDYGVGFEVQTGGGFDSTTPQGKTDTSIRFSFDVTRLNFLGRDHTVAFKSRVSDIQQRVLLSYEAPRWFGSERLKLNFTTFYDNTRDVRTFSSRRLEGSVQLEHQLSRLETLLYRFSYRRVEVDESTLSIDPNLIPLLSRPVRVGMPSISYIRDRRDDVISPTKGNYTTVDAGIAAGAFGSEADFMRFAVQNSTYYAFGRPRWILARSTRIGIAEPVNLGGCDPAIRELANSACIPLPERFFAGGASSHRGFAINQAGPRDAETGFPLGGGALFLNNIELRTPPLVLPFIEDNLSFAIFHDMGNVFEDTGDMIKAFTRLSQQPSLPCEDPASTDKCSFSFMAHAVGVGLRYRTPIGPVRVDFGYNLNPPTFPVREENRVETLRRFNFYFSIGPTF